MRLASFEAIIGALHGAEVRYLIAGGLAVGAHGYLRSTRDVDLVVRLVAENVERPFAALQGLGYRPMAVAAGGVRPGNAGEVTGEVSEEVARLLAAMTGAMTRQEMQTSLSLKHEEHFRQAYLVPALSAGLIEMTIPDKPTSRLQKYRPTDKGRAWLAARRSP